MFTSSRALPETACANQNARNALCERGTHLFMCRRSRRILNLSSPDSSVPNFAEKTCCGRVGEIYFEIGKKSFPGWNLPAILAVE